MDRTNRDGPRPRKNFRGFSVIEATIATTFLAIAALIAFPTMISFFDLSKSAREENIAFFNLEAALEDLRSARLNPEDAQENFLNYTIFVQDPAGDWIWNGASAQWIFVGLGQGTHIPMFPKYSMFVPTIENPNWRWDEETDDWIQVLPGQGTHRRNSGAHLNDQTVTVRYEDPTEDPLVATVSVSWLDHAGRRKSKSLTTAITD